MTNEQRLLLSTIDRFLEAEEAETFAELKFSAKFGKERILLRFEIVEGKLNLQVRDERDNKSDVKVT